MRVEEMWLRQLLEFVVPTAHELAVLEEAKSDRRRFKKGNVIAPEGALVRDTYFVVEGWVEGSVGVNYGRSQLTKIYLPGDFAGMPNVAVVHTAEALTALTNVTVDVVPVDRLQLLFER